jgi:hypothetical protein
MSSPADTLFAQLGKTDPDDELDETELHSVLASLGWHARFPAVSAVLERHPGGGLNRPQLDTLLLDIQESLQKTPVQPKEATGVEVLLNHWILHLVVAHVIIALAYHSLPPRWAATPPPLAGAVVMQVGSAILAAVPLTAGYGVITGIVSSVVTLVTYGALELHLGHFQTDALTSAIAQHDGVFGFIRVPAVQLVWQSFVMAYYVARFLWDQRVRYE